MQVAYLFIAGSPWLTRIGLVELLKRYIVGVFRLNSGYSGDEDQGLMGPALSFDENWRFFL